MVNPPYLQNIQAVASSFGTDLKNGLSETEAKARLLEYGPNILKKTALINPVKIFLAQFKQFLVIILLLAAGLSYLLGESVDAVIIAAIVTINAIVGFIQEYRVEKAIEHLKKLVVSESLVIRDGKLLKIPSEQLIPGDLVSLEEGQRAGADLRLIRSYNLQMIESSLTGESTPSEKNENPINNVTPIADQTNMVFASTVVTSGKGEGIVVATGMNTEIGKIAKMVTSTTAPQTPMQIKLNKLGAFLGKVVLGISAVVAMQEFLVGNQRIIDAVISGVALAVAAIPEGLPAVVTISLALGTRRLLKQNALIRNLPAAETLGSADVIGVDKTGTLTQGEMTVRKVYFNGGILSPNDKNLQKIFEVGILSSNAKQNDGKFIGDTTEVALIKAAIDFGIKPDNLDKIYSRVFEVPFSSSRKMLTTVSKKDENFFITSKGATEVILEKCTHIETGGKVILLSNSEKQKILKTNEEFARNALRVLAFAYKEIHPGDQHLEGGKNETTPSRWSEKDTETDLVFLGLQAMMDPPRKQVGAAIKTCQDAGIKVVMITGDHLLTAEAIASEIGIQGRSITGLELDKLTDEQFEKQVEEIAIYARVNPEHKLKIIKALKKHGHQVAMTGDGVNDAPALKASDIGVAMGITGTDVAKDSSDMILMDDKFETIVQAIQEGRAIYDNIRKFVNYLLSSNMMEVLLIFFALLLGFPLPLLPIHLLWINLITDGFPAIALGVDTQRENIMGLKPAQFSEQIITKKFFKKMILASFILTIPTLLIFFVYKDSLIHAQTLAFTAVVLYEMIRLLDIRADYNLKVFSNKYLNLAVLTSILLQLMVLYLPLKFGSTTLQSLFKVQPLNLIDWVVLLSVGIILFFVMRFVDIKYKNFVY